MDERHADHGERRATWLGLRLDPDPNPNPNPKPKPKPKPNPSPNPSQVSGELRNAPRTSRAVTGASITLGF